MTPQPTGDQVEAVSTVAHAFAQLLISPSSSRVESLCHSLTPAELRRLKRYLAQIWLEKDTFLPLLSLSTGLALCHDRIAEALEQMLEERYTGSLTDDIQHETSMESLQTSKLWKFAYVLGKPPMGFRAEVAIREDAGKVLPELLSLLRTWNNLVEDLVPDDPDAAEMDDNTKSRKHPKPQIEMTAFQGSVSIRTGAENLHQTLHRYWPCQLDGHDHDGALGECMEAELQLEPQWITHGNQENSFFLILKGSEMSQECKIHLSQTIDRDFEPDDEEAACLLIYDDWQDYCLFLGSDNTGQLWAYPSEALDVQLKIQTDLQSETEYKLLSLEDLFNSLEPTYAAKRVMDMILARSLLLLLDGPWATPCLSLQNISVFCKIENGAPQPQFDKIFISTRFGHGIDLQSLRRQRLPHPFPAIQALGVLMAEIELGDDLSGIYEHMGPKSGVTRQGFVAKRLLKECEKRLPLGAGVLRSIRFCIERSSFEKNIRRSPVGLIQDDTKFIESYYNNIIRPLEEDLVLGAYWSWDEINWRASRKLDDSGISKIITMAAAPPPPPPPPTRRPPSSTSNYGGRNNLPVGLETVGEEKVEQQHRFQHARQGHNIPDLVFDGGTCDLAVGEISISTDQWFGKLKDVHTNLNRDRMDELGEDEVEDLIKVAVLDTGVDMTHETFKEFVENGQLDAGYDFVNRGQPMTDLDGHGTHCCDLVFKTAPYARVYPLRVFMSSKREDTTPTLVKEAIYHAIETLDVDIISMSFAFEEEELAIKDALYNAKKKSLKPVLMFAAASNNRALQHQPIGYPARVNDRVICVNSSTVQDEKSSFSPRGIPGWPNLSAVGENVLAAWPTSRSGPWKRMSGTSCATPIVAGVAALILDFSKKDIPELRNQHGWNARKAELWETLGMRSVLRRCLTDEYKDGTYNFLRPWKLLTEPEQAIAVRVEEALKSKHHWG